MPLRGTSPKGGSKKSAPERGAAAAAAEGCGRHPRFYEIPGEFAMAPLGFPRGEAGFFGNRNFGTDCQKRLMRDGVHQRFHEGFGEWRRVLVL